MTGCSPSLGFGDRERAIGHYLSKKYRHDTDAPETSVERCEHIVAAFATLHAAGHGYLLGPSLTALDLAWAAFAALLRPLPEALCPMKPLWRDLYTWTPSQTSAASLDALLSFRERVYRDHLPLPVDVG